MTAKSREGYNKALDDVLEVNADMQAYVDIQKETSLLLPNEELQRLIELFGGDYKNVKTVKIINKGNMTSEGALCQQD